ncbi:hypothetical protein NL676_039075 [Syzygium grande]|nr:hypothetical protein NL676_039075 [Syzygium grande]
MVKIRSDWWIRCGWCCLRSVSYWIGLNREKLLPITFEPRLALLAGEDEVMEVVSGAHGMDGNVGEGARVEALDLDVTAQGGEFAVEGTKLTAATGCCQSAATVNRPPSSCGLIMQSAGRPWWDPWELPQKFHGESIIPPDDKVQQWWFFCLQTPQQVKRSTPSGYWKKTGPNRNVKARDMSRVIGNKKTLVFHIGRASEGISTKWVIHEYHLLTNDLNRNYVLCCLKHTRDEKADNSTIALAHGAISLADLDSDLHQPDNSTIELAHGAISLADLDSDLHQPDNSTIELAHGAISLADLESDLHQPDHEDSFPEPLIQGMMNSLIEGPFHPENRLQVHL